ncbi:UDP-glucose 4-epimerase GalE, partial [Kitasatospora purpeofusca]
VHEVIESVKRVTGREIPVVVSGRRAGDPAVLVASAERAHRALGWTPRRPNLDDIVADAWKFTLEKNAG